MPSDVEVFRLQGLFVSSVACCLASSEPPTGGAPPATNGTNKDLILFPPALFILTRLFGTLLKLKRSY